MVRERLSGFYCTCVTHLKSLVVSPVSPLRTVVPNSGARPERMWWASTASKFFTTCSPTREDSRTHSHSFAPVLTWGGGKGGREGRERGREGREEAREGIQRLGKTGERYQHKTERESGEAIHSQPVLQSRWRDALPWQPLLWTWRRAGGGPAAPPLTNTRLRHQVGLLERGEDMFSRGGILRGGGTLRRWKRGGGYAYHGPDKNCYEHWHEDTLHPSASADKQTQIEVL